MQQWLTASGQKGLQERSLGWAWSRKGSVRSLALECERLSRPGGHPGLYHQGWSRGAHEDRPQAAATPEDPEGTDVQGALAVQ